jgi:hypothetical protein
MYNKTLMDNMWDVISGTMVQMLYNSWEYFYEIHVKHVYPKVSPSQNYNRTIEVEFM